MPAAAEYYGSEDAWKQLVDRDDLDLVYVVTDWKTMHQWASMPWKRQARGH